MRCVWRRRNPDNAIFHLLLVTIHSNARCCDTATGLIKEIEQGRAYGQAGIIFAAMVRASDIHIFEGRDYLTCTICCCDLYNLPLSL